MLCSVVFHNLLIYIGAFQGQTCFKETLEENILVVFLSLKQEAASNLLLL